MKPEERMVSNTTWIMEFRKDYKSWLPKDKLFEKYKWVVSYEELLERFIGLFIEREWLRTQINTVLKALLNSKV